MLVLTRGGPEDGTGTEEVLEALVVVVAGGTHGHSDGHAGGCVGRPPGCRIANEKTGGTSQESLEPANAGSGPLKRLLFTVSMSRFGESEIGGK